ncbi:MAG: XdhC family protein [Ilumatobacteraceae bacterium]
MELYDVLSASLRARTPVALATIISGPGTGAKLLVRPDAPTLGSLGHAELDRIVERDTLGELDAGRTGIRHYGPEGQTTPEDLADSPVLQVFVECWAPPPQMWIFGAVDFTAALARVAKVLGYRVTVCDAREVFATKRRFPMADEVLVTWPGRIFEERGSTLGPRDAGVHLDPRRQVRRAGGAGRRGHPCRLCRGQGFTAHPRAPAGAAGRGRRDRSCGPVPPPFTHRAGHRRANARGDGDLDLRRDHRLADRSFGSRPAGHRRPDPLIAQPSGSMAADRDRLLEAR